MVMPTLPRDGRIDVIMGSVMVEKRAEPGRGLPLTDVKSPPTYSFEPETGERVVLGSERPALRQLGCPRRGAACGRIEGGDTCPSL